MNSESTTETQQASEMEHVAREHLRIFAAGDYAAVAANVTPDYLNHRSIDEPFDCRQRGPEGLKGSMRWISRAFTDMHFDVNDAVVTGNRVALYAVLHGRQHGPFTVHNSPDGRCTEIFPSKGRSFAARQIHWFIISNGAVAEHDAVRDDLGMAQQLGWIPPTPGYIVRMQVALRNERSAARAKTPAT